METVNESSDPAIWTDFAVFRVRRYESLKWERAPDSFALLETRWNRSMFFGRAVDIRLYSSGIRRTLAAKIEKFLRRSKIHGRVLMRARVCAIRE